jgi:hypothetical protein
MVKDFIPGGHHDPHRRHFFRIAVGIAIAWALMGGPVA